MLSRMVVSQVKHNSYFLVGLGVGLWLALACVPIGDDVDECLVTTAALSAEDEFAPARDERRGGGPGGGGRAPMRPRYYTTELGVRQPLLAAVLSSQDAIETRGAALNATAGGHLGGALRFFMAATAPASAPARPNVVGFTDTREMLKPFHAIKYLADNYLDEYDFFFLVSDSTFVNARRLTELVSKLSRSQHVYMGEVAEDDSHYCTLEGGILLSNSVLRLMHGALDWCVRNSYSSQHHENLGRCVLHAAHRQCDPRGYRAERAGGGQEGLGGVAAAVTAHPVTEPERFHQLHAYVSRVYLERLSSSRVSLSRRAVQSARHHPAGHRNHTWPRGLRSDPGLAPPPPNNRFDHLRWTWFNLTHALQPDDRREVATHSHNIAKAVQLVWDAARAFALPRWGAGVGGVREGEGGVRLVEGAWRWEPATALTYRLLLERGGKMMHVEVSRGIGAARLVSVPYVTESARVWIVLPVVLPGEGEGAGGFLRRYEALCLQRHANTALIVVLLSSDNSTSTDTSVQDTVHALQDKWGGARLVLLRGGLGGSHGGSQGGPGGRGRRALDAARGALPRDALVLLSDQNMDFNDDFLNRVRMGCIPGTQWVLPIGFSRYSVYPHPRFSEGGTKPQTHTGRFNQNHRDVCAFYQQDWEKAVSSAPPTWGCAEVLSSSGVRSLHAPEPALLHPPRPPPCHPHHHGGGHYHECLRELDLATLDLGARHTLAKLLLQDQDDKS